MTRQLRGSIAYRICYLLPCWPRRGEFCSGTGLISSSRRQSSSVKPATPGHFAGSLRPAFMRSRTPLSWSPSASKRKSSSHRPMTAARCQARRSQPHARSPSNVASRFDGDARHRGRAPAIDVAQFIPLGLVCSVLFRRSGNPVSFNRLNRFEIASLSSSRSELASRRPIQLSTSAGRLSRFPNCRSIDPAWTGSVDRSIAVRRDSRR